METDENLWKFMVLPACRQTGILSFGIWIACLAGERIGVNMPESCLSFVFREKIVLKKLLITIGAVLVARLIYFLPVPGIDTEAVIRLYQQHIYPHGGRWVDLLVLLHAGRLRNISLFALGIMPYLNACIIIQIIGFLLPGIQRIFFYEKDGRRRMLFATLMVAVVLSMIHGYFASIDLELLNHFPDFEILHLKGFFFRVSTMICMSAAVAFLVFVARLIDDFGLGNGIGIIFASEIVIRLLFSLHQAAVFYVRGAVGDRTLILFLGIVIAFICFAGFVTNFSKKLELQTENCEKCYILVRPEWVGIWPLIISEVIFSFFQFPLNARIFFYIVVTIALVSLCYSKIVYQPRGFYELMLTHKCKAQLPKGKRVEDFLNSAVLQCLGLSVLLFILIYYLPVLLPLVFKISFMSAGIFGTFGIIILVGVYYDFLEQVKFWRRRQESAVKDWKLLNVAFDETEAEITKLCLSGSGIAAEIKPSNFRWGLPVRTAGSGYSIFIPAEKTQEAGTLLENLWQERREKAF